MTAKVNLQPHLRIFLESYQENIRKFFRKIKEYFNPQFMYGAAPLPGVVGVVAEDTPKTTESMSCPRRNGSCSRVCLEIGQVIFSYGFLHFISPATIAGFQTPDNVCISRFFQSKGFIVGISVVDMVYPVLPLFSLTSLIQFFSVSPIPLLLYLLSLYK